MKRSLACRLVGLERKKADAVRTHYLFLDNGETDAGACRDRMIASGKASPTDHFIAFRWKTPEEDA
jgi:hypothetical protein